MSKGSRLLWGAGINDSTYTTTKWHYTGTLSSGGGKRIKVTWKCPYYARWVEIIRRCYSKRYKEKRPTYNGCSVCIEWLTFSNFREWMTTQTWEGLQIDKDLLVVGNRDYSPKTCVFVTSQVNNFILDRGNDRGNYLIGVSRKKNNKSFVSRCMNPLTGKRKSVGSYCSELEAHFAWKKQKHSYACQLANSKYVIDGRVRDVLLHRYENYSTVECHLR